MLNLFQPLPSQAIFSRDPCPLALGSKRALPPLPFFPGRVEAFLFLSFFFSARCRVLNAGDEIIHHRTKTRVSLLPWSASRFRASFASFPRAKIGTRGSIRISYDTLTCPAFTRDWQTGIFVRSTSLLHGKLLTRNGKKQGIFSCRKLSILRWLYFVDLRRKMRLQFLEHWFRNYTICIFVILPVRRWRFTSYQEYRA